MYACPRGHTYDIARTGYLNLLQPQDRRSLDAGDLRAAVEARAALIASGIGRSTIDAVVASAARMLADRIDPVVVELGSGTGEVIGALGHAEACAIGIDLSTHAAAHAARRYPGSLWVVANADRRLPVLDQAADLVVSVHARRNPPECRRILKSDGRLLVAVPAADDLIELRESLQGQRVERDRVETLVLEHAELFSELARARVTAHHTFDPDTLQQVLRATYRGARFREAERVRSLGTLTVTLSSDIVTFAPR